MIITLTPKNSAALLFLSFIMQETHEIAHTGVGRLICGCWGKRNFNLWQLCEGCSDEHPLSILATYAGPIYSFSVIWIGFLLLRKASTKIKSIGFALIISSMPFSRIITPLFGGGDEIYALNKSLDNHSFAWFIGLIAVLLLLIPPLVLVWNTIENKQRLWFFLGLIFIPFLLTGIVVFGLLQNLLLDNGVFSEYWIMGSPQLVTIWFIVSIIIFLLFGNSLSSLLQPNSDKTHNGMK